MDQTVKKDPYRFRWSSFVEHILHGACSYAQRHICMWLAPTAEQSLVQIEQNRLGGWEMQRCIIIVILIYSCFSRCWVGCGWSSLFCSTTEQLRKLTGKSFCIDEKAALFVFSQWLSAHCTTMCAVANFQRKSKMLAKKTRSGIN
jgi:hypothetical protein